MLPGVTLAQLGSSGVGTPYEATDSAYKQHIASCYGEYPMKLQLDIPAFLEELKSIEISCLLIWKSPVGFVNVQLMDDTSDFSALSRLSTS